MRTLTLLAATGLTLAPTLAGAATFRTIDNPLDPTFNQLLGINNSGVIAGYYGSGAAGHPNQGYTVAAPYTTFTPENYPTSVQTQVTGINNTGYTVGFFSNTNQGVGIDANSGFSATGGFARPYDLSNGAPPVTQLLGINDNNVSVGFYNDANGNAHGFAMQTGSGGFSLNPQLGAAAILQGGGAPKPVTITGAVAVTATGINNTGLISGFYVDANTGNTLGFLEGISSTTFTAFEAPGSTNTQFLGVNNKGQAVGFYTDGNGIDHGVLYSVADGTFQKIDDPNGVNGTVLNGLNDLGQLVGFYMDAAENTHGVLVGTAVPEPSSLAVLLAGGLMIGGLRVARRR